MQKMNTFVKSFLCVTLVHNACATPVKSTAENIEEVEVVVGVEDSKLVEVNSRTPTSTNIAGSLVTDVKQINLFLNIPTGCNSIYDQLITQLVACREGSDRGDPRLQKGCLLRMDFKKYKNECATTGVYFPAVGETPWHPEPTCNGTYCEESSDLVFGTKSSTDAAANVAFPEEEESKTGYVVPGKNEEDDKLLVTLLDILNSKGKNSIRSGLENE